jgi:cysteine desulfurase / selenocysteine lyase
MSLPDVTFGPFDGRVWLNAAHQGPLPRDAVEAAGRALQRKVQPNLIADEDFHRTPARLRAALARLVNAHEKDIVLGNSASYGLQLIANGLTWRAGDEVLVPTNDFPASILPWTVLEPAVTVRGLATDEGTLTADALASRLGDRTRVVCISWVNSFSGRINDLGALGSLCRDRGVLFVVNATQGLGSLSLDVDDLPVDAVTSCGFKWLCGPYGTGFCWLHPDLQARLESRQAYWLTLAGERWSDLERAKTWSFASKPSPDEHDDASIDLGAARFDVFGTANFLNFEPWTASIEHFLAVGLDAISEHNARLIDRLLDGVDADEWRIINGHNPLGRSTMVVLEPRRGSADDAASRLTRAGVDVAERRGRIRISPHLYTSSEDIDRALTALA